MVLLALVGLGRHHLLSVYLFAGLGLLPSLGWTCCYSYRSFSLPFCFMGYFLEVEVEVEVFLLGEELSRPFLRLLVSGC